MLHIGTHKHARTKMHIHTICADQNTQECAHRDTNTYLKFCAAVLWVHDRLAHFHVWLHHLFAVLFLLTRTNLHHLHSNRLYRWGKAACTASLHSALSVHKRLTAQPVQCVCMCVARLCRVPVQCSTWTKARVNNERAWLRRAAHHTEHTSIYTRRIALQWSMVYDMMIWHLQSAVQRSCT